jgi:hypothetical protein
MNGAITKRPLDGRYSNSSPASAVRAHAFTYRVSSEVRSASSSSVSPSMLSRIAANRPSFNP